jgi:ABC-type transporter Mla MlaB component
MLSSGLTATRNMLMTRLEVLQRLQNIESKAKRALDLLQVQPVSTAALAELQSLVQWLKDELHSEYTRISTERVQRTMTMFELSVYLPTIREAFTDSGIGQLKVDSTPARTWLQPLEVVIDRASKRLR